MSARQPFIPKFGGAANIAVTTTSQSVALGKDSKSLCITNLSTGLCWIRVGVGVQTATTSDYAVLPNSQVVISKDHDADQLGVIGFAATTLHVIPGEGW
jgi:hypothetical protein